MSAMYLTGCYDSFPIKQIADLLGIVLNLLYKFLDLINITNIGICIILFTLIIKMIMLPLTIKQQKFTKLSSVMSPELQAIQKKYKGKTDQDSMLKMQEETRAVYNKYGVSQTGGCVQMLIQMPILFALYAVISCIPNYVTDVNDIYLNEVNTGIVDEIYEDSKEINNLDSIYKLVIDYDSKKDTEGFTYEFAGINKYLSNYDLSKEEKTVKNSIYSNLVSINYSEANWNMIDNMYEQTISMVAKMESVSGEDWDKLIEDITAKKEAATDEKEANAYSTTINLINSYRETGFSNIKAELNKSLESINDGKSEIKNIYGFLGIDLSKSPKNDVMWALLIPILAALTQWFSMKISTGSQNTNSQDNPMASSMKAMSITMPLISAFFCYSLPAGLGLYWVATAVFQIAQQIIINAYFKKVDVQQLIEENIKKANKKRAKRGLPENSISNAAKSSTKNINYNSPSISKTKEDIIDMEETNEEKKNDKPKGKIASRANMVKEFNERNK